MKSRTLALAGAIIATATAYAVNDNAQVKEHVVKRIKDDFVKKIKVEIKKEIDHASVKKCLLGKVYQVEITRPEQGMGLETLLKAAFVVTDKDIVEIRHPSTTTEVEGLVSVINPAFKLKTEDDGNAMADMLAMVILAQRDSIPATPTVKRDGKTWTFITGKFFKKHKGFIVETDDAGNVVKISFVLGIVMKEQ